MDSAISDDPPQAVQDLGSDHNAENEQAAQNAAKKRNRRKEKPRKKKVDSPTDETAPLAAQIESLNLNSSSLPIEVVEPIKKLTDSVPEDNFGDRADDMPNMTASPSKRRIRKKKNVALASIQKLSHANGGSTAVSNGNQNTAEGGVQFGEAILNNVKLPNFEALNVLEKLGQCSPKPHHIKQSSGSPSKHLSSSPQKSLGQHKPQSPLKQKQDVGNIHKKAANKRDENMLLNENKFEAHLQRELVEVMLKEQLSVVKGFIRINQRNYREAYISSPDGSKDILIDGVKDRNRAFEGDEVVVQYLPPSSWKRHAGEVQKVAKVIHIFTRVHHRQAVGSLKKMQDGNSRSALFSPRDSRIPRMRIAIKECPRDPKDWENRLFQARIVQWEDVRFALGRLTGDCVGVEGDIEAETRAILLDNELGCTPYDLKLYKHFPTPPFHPSEDDFRGREDLRKLCIFTIDPSTAKDLDDAVSCEKLSNGNYKVGVHISDVSYFLKEGTLLDKEVSRRATTTYLVQRAYHMLPREMTLMCSLLPAEDKLAFSVFWEITPEAEVISHYFTRSVINSCAQLAYEHAQIMIDDPDHVWKDGELPQIYNGWTVEDLKKVVLSLQSLAVPMRKRRFDTGALKVDQIKIMFRLNDAGEPVSFSACTSKESHRLIEEFMLLANMTVATDLQAKFPKLAFLRCHDEPQPDMLKKLVDLVEKFGIILDTSSAGSLHKSLQGYSANSNDARFMALNSLCSRPMVRARYFCAANINDVAFMRHYALNVPLYTHFTSPIRRYADVMVHRLLCALKGYSKEPKWSVDNVNNIAANCNKMKFNAKRAGEQSIELFFALWVRNHGPVEEEVVVIDVKDHSFDALVCSTGSNVRVYTDKVPGSVEFDNASVPQLRIVWSIAGGCTQSAYQVITMFSVVRVSLRSSNTNLLKVDATLLPPKS